MPPQNNRHHPITTMLSAEQRQSLQANRRTYRAMSLDELKALVAERGLQESVPENVAERPQVYVRALMQAERAAAREAAAAAASEE